MGAGIFFAGYVLFEIPGALIAERWSARIWLARIMISWGIISSCFLFVRGPVSFYLLRFGLGAAEAGAAPAPVRVSGPGPALATGRDGAVEPAAGFCFNSWAPTTPHCIAETVISLVAVVILLALRSATFLTVRVYLPPAARPVLS